MLVGMRHLPALDALLQVAETSDGAMEALASLLAQAAAGRALASDVAGMISDLFGGSPPRSVGEAARSALAVYGVTKELGAGADAIRKLRENKPS